MRYILALAEKAMLAGFDTETHNIVNIEGEGRMVITEKGMMASALLTGDESQRLSQVKGMSFGSQRELETYLRNFNIE